MWFEGKVSGVPPQADQVSGFLIIGLTPDT